MKVRFFSFWWGLAITTLASLNLAAQLPTTAPSAADAPPPIPSPDRLQADWWTYFDDSDATEQSLEDRIEAFRAQLETQFSALPPANLSVLESLREQLNAQLDRYLTLQSTATPPPKPLPVPAERYTVELALERHLIWRQFELETKALEEELAWQEALLERTLNQQSQRRANYLELKRATDDRFQAGLRLMKSRTELEVRQAELATQKQQLEGRKAELGALAEEMTLIPKRLSPRDDSPEYWEGQVTEAEAALAGLEEAEAPSSSAASTENGAAAVARYSLLSSVHQELQLALAELKLSQAKLGRVLTQVLQSEDKLESSRLEEPLRIYRERSLRVDELRQRGRTASDRVRTAASNQLASGEDQTANETVLEDTLALANETSQLLRQLDLERSGAAFLADILEQRSGNWLAKSSGRTKRSIGMMWKSFTDALSRPLFEVSETPVTSLGIARALLILFLAWWGSKFLRRGLERLGRKRRNLNRSSLYMLERLIHYTVLTIGVLIGLSSLGLDLTKFALFASALGVGVGFGLQTLVSNFIAGLIILFEKSLNVGDFVELQSGLTGEVREINMRSTLITTNDNVDILVPNSDFVANQVTNWTLREALRRVHISFGVAYGSDKDKVKQAVLEAADRVPWTYAESKRRAPRVWLVGFGDSSLDFELVVWLTPEAVKRPAAVQADYLWEIETSLNEHGIEIPFPQRDLHIRSGLDKLSSESEKDEDQA